MNINLEPGKYVVAVSGGVDSVVLLHKLADNSEFPTSDYRFAVAHLDHGIRDDSVDDRQSTGDLAAKYKLPFYYDEGKLGPDASEAEARTARYTFLRKIRKSTDSKAIITAHHQDDRIETVFINLLRGTGRKGLSSLGSGPHIRRPLLNMSKREIIQYAQKYNLTWREDSTNQDNKYLRNNLRNRVLSKLTDMQRERILEILDTSDHQNREIDTILDKLLNRQDSDQMKRAWFIALPHTISGEVLSHWLRNENMSFDHMAIERLIVSLKTLNPGTKTDINGGWYFTIGSHNIRIHRG